MKIKTTRFGEINIKKDSIISFPNGILGFPDRKKYVVLDHDSDDTPFKWLQCVDDPNLAFIIMDPSILIEEYRVEIDTEIMKELSEVKDEDIFLLAIVKIPHNSPMDMTANLKAPIVVNYQKKEAYQVVLMNDNYSLSHPIFKQEVLV